MTSTMIATTKLQAFVIDEVQTFKQSHQVAALEAVKILESQGTIDPEVIEGIICDEMHLTQDLRKTVIERIEDEHGVAFSDYPEYVLLHMDWDGIIAGWLAEENAIAVQVSAGTLIVWRYPVEFYSEFEFAS